MISAAPHLREDSPEEVQRAFESLCRGYEHEPYPEYDIRVRRLHSLLTLIEDNEARIADAISADFGNRSRFEIGLSEVFLSIAEIKHTLRHLRRWMRPTTVSTPLYLRPGRAHIERQPLGVVGIISPWNYPLFLSISPLAGALAAGNRVLLKPSELTPRFSDLLRVLIAEHFSPNEILVVTGGRNVGGSLSHLPLNHLFFTGSTSTGREIAKAAAENLTPVTLELGGKSPAIIGAGADLARAARSIANGKLLNAGQTCIAPDYCLVPHAELGRFSYEIAEAAIEMFPDAAANADYTSIISDGHLDRLRTLVDEAQQTSAETITAGAADTVSRRMPLQIVVQPSLDTALMQEEIFGPVLPILSYDSFDDVIEIVRRGPRPLASYFFGHDPKEQKRVLREITCGDVTINDTLCHIALPTLPFGGTGASGIGAYHGEHSFRRFSHEKGVFVQWEWSLAPFLYPPYGKTAQRILKLLRRMI
jgi:coniferyl-aldehyde dehydrogenase